MYYGRYAVGGSNEWSYGAHGEPAPEIPEGDEEKRALIRKGNGTVEMWYEYEPDQWAHLVVGEATWDSATGRQREAQWRALRERLKA